MWAWHSIAQDMLSICGRTHTAHTHTRTGTHILRLWCICFYLFLLAATMCGLERGVFWETGVWGLEGGGYNEDVHEIKQFWVAQRMPMMQLHVRVCLRVCQIVHYLPTKPFGFDARALFENSKLKCCLIKAIYINWYTCVCVCKSIIRLYILYFIIQLYYTLYSIYYCINTFQLAWSLILNRSTYSWTSFYAR